VAAGRHEAVEVVAAARPEAVVEAAAAQAYAQVPLVLVVAAPWAP
jgi:hypothetical protein